MDKASCTEVNSVNQGEDIVGAELSSESTFFQPGSQMDRLDQTEQQDPQKSIPHIRPNEFSTSDQYVCNADGRKVLSHPSCVAEDQHAAVNCGFVSHDSQKLQDRDRCFNRLDGTENEAQTSDNPLPYFTDDMAVGSDRYPDVVVRDSRSPSPEVPCIPEPDCSPDSVSDGDFFARTGSDRVQDTFRTLFASGNSVADRSVARGADLSFESFRRSTALHFFRRFARQRSSSVPPQASDRSESAVRVEDVAAANDEADGPPDVETPKISSRAESSEILGDELWSDDERPVNTVSSCYVKVTEPLRSRNVAASRFVWEEGFLLVFIR